jgi:hypothetical protein
MYYTRGAQKVMQHIYFLRPILLDKNNIYNNNNNNNNNTVAFKCPTFMHVVARFPTRQ